MSADAETPSIRVETMLKDPSYELNGEVYMDAALTDWTPIEVTTDPTECNHLEMMCPECTGSWQADHWIRVVEVNCGHALGINEVPGYETLSNIEEEGSNDDDLR